MLLSKPVHWHVWFCATASNSGTDTKKCRHIKLIKYMKKIYLLAMACLFMAGCNDFEENINIDPNQPSEASNTQLLAYSMRSLPDLNASASGALYAQQISETEYITLSRYDNVFYNFYGYYTGPLMNLETVLTSNQFDVKEGPIANQLAVAKVLKAYYFWYMTDRWGDLPYTQALKGKGDFTPAYDTQQDIYNGLFALLDEANAQFIPGAISNDIVYGGDPEKWKRLGNTIHMLMALRLSKVDAAKGSQEFNKALEAGIMTSNDDNLAYKHLSDPNNWNYWYNVFSIQNREWYAVSKPLVDYMKPVNDPRLPVYAEKNAEGEYAGLEYGLEGDQVNTGDYQKKNISLLGKAVRQPNSPVYLITYAQALFAKAEAAKIGWIPGGDIEAESNYNQAIESSVEQWNNGSAAGLDVMMQQPEVKYNPAEALKQIGYQRWVHLFLNGYEAWAEWKRTGYPELTAPENNNGRAIPRREGYPTQEAQNNTDNYNTAIQRAFGGTNDLYGRVWWDRP
jgi:hypothetical protein